MKPVVVDELTIRYTYLMEEGCSACACGVPGACDQFYWPHFLWPGIVVLIVTLLVLISLSRKNVLKIQFKILLAMWLGAVLVFAGAVYLNTESAGDQTRRAAEHCQSSRYPACEY